MKLFAAIAVLATGVASLRSGSLTNTEVNHDILGFKGSCCAQNGGDLCGFIFRSCCKTGHCTVFNTCPDKYEYKC